LALITSLLSVFSAKAHATSPTCYTVEAGVLTDGSECFGSIVIHNGVTSIGADAFLDNTEISSVEIPSSVVAIGDRAFKNTWIKNLTFSPNSDLESIGVAAFRSSRIRSVILPNSLKTIGSEAFHENWYLLYVQFGTGNSQLTTIGSWAFAGNNAPTTMPLTTIVIPDSVTSIGENAFAHTTLADITFLGIAPTGTGDIIINLNISQTTNGHVKSINRSSWGTPFPETWRGLQLLVGDGPIFPAPTIIDLFQGFNRDTEFGFFLGTPIEILVDYFAVGSVDFELVGDPIPSWLQIDSEGTISGTPDEVGLTTFDIRVTDERDQSDTLTEVSIRVVSEVALISMADYIRSSDGLNLVNIDTDAPWNFNVRVFKKETGPNASDGMILAAGDNVKDSDFFDDGLNWNDQITQSADYLVFRIYEPGAVDIGFETPYLASLTIFVVPDNTLCDGANFECQIGDIGPGGGTIFYIAPEAFTQVGATGAMCSTDCRYLEAAPYGWLGEGPDPSFYWSSEDNQGASVSGANAIAIGTGFANSIAIQNQAGNDAESSAAVAARVYVGGDKTDWFLPSKEELYEFFNQRVIVQAVSGDSFYWSSSELSATDAWMYDFGDGVYFETSKSSVFGRVRPIRAFAPAILQTIQIGTIAGLVPPVSGSAPVTSITETESYTGSVTWSPSATQFSGSTVYTATINLTPKSGYTTIGVEINSFSVEGATSVVNSQNSGTVTVIFPATSASNSAQSVVAYVPPTPIPYLRTLTTPKLNLKDGKLVCSPGTYNAGYTLDGVIQGSPTALFSPAAFTFNLLINGIAQTTSSVITSNSQAVWDLPIATSGALLACSVAVSANSITNINRSSDNISGASPGLSAQSISIATANADYSAQLTANSRAYQKTLVDNRADWRKSIETNRATYFAERDRIKALGTNKQTRAQNSLALKKYIEAQKQIASDYAASKPAAIALKNAADKAALDTKNAAITKANATYGAFIESIGYGVLVP
jgi:hypothetical protein